MKKRTIISGEQLLRGMMRAAQEEMDLRRFIRVLRLLRAVFKCDQNRAAVRALAIIKRDRLMAMQNRDRMLSIRNRFVHFGELL
jgi:hypothetical protein